MYTGTPSTGPSVLHLFSLSTVILAGDASNVLRQDELQEDLYGNSCHNGVKYQ